MDRKTDGQTDGLNDFLFCIQNHFASYLQSATSSVAKCLKSLIRHSRTMPLTSALSILHSTWSNAVSGTATLLVASKMAFQSKSSASTEHSDVDEILLQMSLAAVELAALGAEEGEQEEEEEDDDDDDDDDICKGIDVGEEDLDATLRMEVERLEVTLRETTLGLACVGGAHSRMSKAEEEEAPCTGRLDQKELHSVEAKYSTRKRQVCSISLA